ncbi:Exocyst complex component SEC6 [Cyberlindnera fabianii]|uniref:Exocyst complex component SEC6 n=1 Tax=Cyberlindnera fabianii TaxID=36022 RepID=A0A1V2L3Y3_CYBFA|nr:Exocyst complex component SEC6 [Cyberlindnera fabianii]
MTTREAALRNIGQLLKTEEDLDKINTLRTQLQTEKSAIDVKLKSLAQTQLDHLLRDMDHLSLCQEDVRSLRDNLSAVSSIATESFGSISRFELINNITHVHEIFDQSSRIAEDVGSFNARLQEVDRMIEEEQYESIGPDSEVPGLLPIHFKLNALRDFQDRILELAEKSSDDSKFTVKRLTSKTDGVIKKFDRMLGNIIEGIVESVKEENFSLVVRLAKVIEFEEKQDTMIEALKKVIEGKNKEKKGSVSLFEQIVNGTLQGRTKPRHYKHFFLEKITDSVREIFKNCWATFEDQGDIFAILNELSWVFHDLAAVQQVLTGLVPPKWDIFKVYYDIYYNELHTLIVRLIESEPETLIILDILDFDNQFQEIMRTDFNLKKADVKTVIGESEKEQLLTDYLNLIVMKMKEWVGNLESTEHEVFKTRIQAPDADSEGLLALEGTKIVFQMFTQQCETAAGSGQGKILAGVISEFGKLLIKRQQTWGELVKSEVQKWLVYNNIDSKKKKQETEEEEITPVPAGLIEYLTALANDQMRGADYTEAISNKYGGMVSKKYASMIHTDLESTIDGFANLAKQCCDGLIVIIFDDLKVVMDKIFTKDWTSANYSQQISDTLREYLGELKMSMNSYLFEILSEDIIEECILRYLNNLNNDVKFPKTTDKLLTCVKRDFEVFYKLFVQFINQNTIESKFKIVENFMDLSTEPDLDQILVHWQSTVANFPDIKPEFLSLVLKARRDIDSSDAKMIIPRAKEVQKKFIDENQYNLEPSFMGRFSLNSKIKKNYL